jgi:hypothetical protein
LPLAAIFNSTRLILGQILSSRAGPTGVSNSRASSGRPHSGTAGNSRRDLSSPALQEIARSAACPSRSCCAARPSRTRSSDGAGCRTRNVEEIIQLARGRATRGGAIRGSAAGGRALPSRGAWTRRGATGAGPSL